MKDRDDKIKRVLALQELERRKTIAPLVYWRPHARQAEVFEHTKTHRVVIFGGGNRSGKSSALAARAISICYGYHIWDVPDLTLDENGDYPSRDRVDPAYWIRRADGLPMRSPPEVLMVTGLSMQKGIGSILWPKLQDYLPRAVLSSPDFKSSKGPYGVPIRAELPNGALIYFGSAEQSSMMFEGTSYDAALFDEPLPRSHFAPVWRGLTDYYGPVFFALTPLGPHAPFVYQEFIAKDRKDVAFVQASIHDNPHLSSGAVREFLEGGGFNEDEMAARQSGQWIFLSHRAFPTFDPAAHVIPPHRIPSEWTRMLVIDPAHRRPFAMVWLAFGPNEEVRVYREWPKTRHSAMRSSGMTVGDYATVIRNEEGGETVDCRVLDPRFGKAEHSFKGQKQTSIQEDFAKYGLFFDCRVPHTGSEETGIQEIRRLLRWDRQSPITQLNRPKFQVFTHCRNTIDALALSNFVPPPARDPDILPEKLLELEKDFRDCLRYGVLYDRPSPGAYGTTGYISEEELERWNSHDW